MPTLNWVQEAAWDREAEIANDFDEKLAPTYSCRICGNVYDSISERDQHELSHPVSNPSIFIDGKEVCAENIEVTSLLTQNKVHLRNVDFLTINDISCKGKDELLTQMTKERIGFFDVCYGNDNIVRRVKIKICIADLEELNAVDRVFMEIFSTGTINDTAIIGFTERVKEWDTVGSYIEGLVRYLQGLMAKDNTSGMISFENFAGRLNQATNSLKNYETGLSLAISSVVNFNRNDFASMHHSGIPLLDNAVSFFKGGELLESNSSGENHLLPVDYATECILSKLLIIYKDGLLEELEQEVSTFAAKYLSLQDKLKFDYICWRKSVQVNNLKSAKVYQQRLRFDDVFSVLVERK